MNDNKKHTLLDVVLEYNIYVMYSLNNNVWVCTRKYFFPKKIWGGGQNTMFGPTGKVLGVI